MTRRNPWDNASARERHALGLFFVTHYAVRRQVVRRTVRDGRIVRDTLKCGHTYQPSNDRRREFTKTRRCWECGTATRLSEIERRRRTAVDCNTLTGEDVP